MNKLNNRDSLEILKELVERFTNNIEVYKSSRYDESNTRTDFIDKFFSLLGWDIYNSAGNSEDFREVIREDKVVIQGRPKSPDYSFKIGRERQFFVEAKKPSVNIHDAIQPAFQLRRYAYTAGLPISILTDFEEFAIYDTNVQPKEMDSASVARIFYCKYTDYIKNWDFMKETISKQAVMQGKLKKYSSENKSKKGTQSVDKELLKLIESWRITLAKNVALNNNNLDIYQLNEAVQIIIDRIIFLRMAEDRNTEIYASLKKLLGQKNIYGILVKYFDSSNKKYNSGLFASAPWLDKLKIDDEIFKSIVNDLYYPMPYEFSVLPIEILGQIYEQFLGKTITLTGGHIADVIEKPEVRKAGGVYYTPKYIVDYIVENTVGKKIENKAPKDVETLTILDPACGSGSFLVGAYKFLLDYHIDYYIKNGNISKAVKEGRIYSAGENDYRLTIREKKKILLNNIYGVDIDRQAVEVTKLSLLLTLMEGEIVESKGEIFLKSISEALLPSLENNIKCGNSLIGTDFYAQMNMDELDKDFQRKINCFDWKDEFKEIIKSGGFEIVIGNPPYIVSRFFSDFDKSYYENNFLSALYQINLYLLFMEKALKLSNDTGLVSMIIPNTWLINRTLLKFRKYLIDKKIFEKIVDLTNHNVFIDATVLPVIFIFNKIGDLNNIHIYELKNNEFININKLSIDEIVKEEYFINYQKNNLHNSIISKVDTNIELLGNLSITSFGVKFYQVNKGIPKQTRKIVDEKVFTHESKINDTCKKILEGKNIERYFTNWSGKWIEYGNWLAEPRNEELFNGKRILVRRIVNGRFTGQYINDNYCNNTLLHTIKLINDKYDIRYILGIINSKMLGFYFVNKYSRHEKVFPEIRIRELNQLPIKKLDLAHSKKEKAQHDRMVSLVEQMLEAQKTAHGDEHITDTDKKLITQRINILDKQIDALVYELYGLTDEEIKIVEGE